MRLRAECEIKAPREIVFEVVSNPERLPEWNGSVLRARRAGAGPVDVGARAVVIGQVLGQQVESETEVVELQRPSTFATRATRGPRLSTIFRLEPVVNGTRMTVEVSGDPPGGKLGAFLAEGMLRAEFQRSLERLRALCQAEAQRAAASEPIEGGDAACWLGELPEAG